jgi:hypothetical protein
MVTFMDGTNVIARNVPLDANGNASFTTSNLSTAGHSMHAFYSGDANVLASSSEFNQSVNKGTVATALKVSPNPVIFGDKVTLTAALNAVSPAAGMPSGTVTFMDGSTPVGSVALNSGQASLTTAALATGSHTITASYSGDASFAAFTSGPVNELVNPAILSLSASQNTLSIASGQSASDTLQVSSQGSLSGPVSFTCAGLPALSQCSFSPATLPASSVPAKVSVTITTSGAQMASLVPAGGTPRGGSLPWSSLGLVLPAAVLITGSRLRRRGAVRLALIVAAAALLLSLAGCGGGSSSSSGGTQPGTYKVMVTATSGSLQGSAPITVTVTQ